MLQESREFFKKWRISLPQSKYEAFCCLYINRQPILYFSGVFQIDQKVFQGRNSTTCSA